jgi:hypothetical protein
MIAFAMPTAEDQRDHGGDREEATLHDVPPSRGQGVSLPPSELLCEGDRRMTDA